jgi:hypothetical protein
MIRQIGFAVGVAIFVTIVGSPDSAEAYMAAFRVAWWAMAAITVLGLLPLLLLQGRAQVRPRSSHIGVRSGCIPDPAFSEPAESRNS